MIQTMLADAGDRLFLVVGATGASIGLILYIALEFYRARQREQTLREIAAYVAEGSITPADGDRLMRAAATDPEGGLNDKVFCKAEFGVIAPAGSDRLSGVRLHDPDHAGGRG